MYRVKARGGLTLIELFIVIAIIATLVALTIPGFLRFRMTANQRAAAASLRALTQANMIFRETDPAKTNQQAYWTGDIAGLYYIQLGSVPPPPANPIRVLRDNSLALADLAPLPEGPYGDVFHNGLPAGATPRPKSGYWFTVMKAFRHPATGGNGGPLGDEYAIIAAPARTGRTGSNVFLTDTGSTIYFRNFSAMGGSPQIGAGEVDKVDAVLPAWPGDMSDWGNVN